MSKREIDLYITDILSAGEKIKKYIKGLEYSDFRKDGKTMDAVIRNLEVIGEAVYNMPGEFKKANRKIPWVSVSDMRNKLIHEYFGVDAEIIWKTVNEDLPEFIREVKKIKSQ